MEIIQKKWSEDQLLKRLGEALNKKQALEFLKQDTKKIDLEIDSWKSRHEKINKK